MASSALEPVDQIAQELSMEFGTRLSAPVLHEEAEQSLARFSDARITAFVTLLALRDARSRLRQRGR